VDVLLSPGRSAGRAGLAGLSGLSGLANVAFALTALHVAWRAATSASSRPWLVSASVVTLHVLMAALFVARRDERGQAGARAWFAALPSLALGAAVAGWPGLHLGPLGAAVFALGALGVVASMLALGRSFAVLPGARALVARGPYRLVRHPMYLCELVMFGALLTPFGALWGAAAVALTLAALVWRVRAEERVLAALPGHAAYVARVRYRLLPWVW
jgi:protein-S-isoprenylcysteine O-methyltransferase Ste14